jgi:hypothetical protein
MLAKVYPHRAEDDQSKTSEKVRSWLDTRQGIERCWGLLGSLLSVIAGKTCELSQMGKVWQGSHVGWEKDSLLEGRLVVWRSGGRFSVAGCRDGLHEDLHVRSGQSQ